MPIYEYQCNECNSHFELLVRNNQEVALCPYCGSLEVSRQVSAFAYFSKDAGGNTTAGSSCGSCQSNNCSSCGK